MATTREKGGDQEEDKEGGLLPTSPASLGFLGAASQVYGMSHNIPMNDSPKERKKNL